MFRRVWQQAELLDRMMEQLGVSKLDAVRLERGAAFREARTQCIECPFSEVCRNWLDATERLPLPPDFCANATFFAHCAARSRGPIASDAENGA